MGKMQKVRTGAGTVGIEQIFTPNEFELRFIIEPQISPYGGPLFFALSLGSAVGNVVANGSYGLLDTGKKKLLVTCCHVWDDYQNLRKSDSELKMLICLDRKPPVVLNSIVPIDQDAKLDIATFDADSLQGACGDRKFYPLDRNPPPRIQKGEKLAFIGYPGRFRSETDLGVHFGTFAYGVNVSDLSGRSVVADISQMRFIYDQPPKLQDAPNPHGGISGSPCFLVRNQRKPKLVAFATSVGLNLLHLTHVNCITPDGTIDTGRPPNLVPASL
jgi:hypothetical protein